MRLELFYGWSILYTGMNIRTRGFLFRALLIGFSVTIDPLCEINNQRGWPVEIYVRFSTIYSPFSAEKSHRLRFLSQEIAAKNERRVGSPLIKSGAEIGSQTPPFLCSKSAFSPISSPFRALFPLFSLKKRPWGCMLCRNLPCRLDYNDHEDPKKRTFHANERITRQIEAEDSRRPLLLQIVGNEWCPQRVFPQNMRFWGGVSKSRRPWCNLGCAHKRSCRGSAQRHQRILPASQKSPLRWSVAEECANRILQVWSVSSKEPIPDIENHKFMCGGLTDFTPVFHYIRNHRLRPNVLIYFTDGEGRCPRDIPPYPVVWVLTKKGKVPVPWGQAIHYAL